MSSIAITTSGFQDSIRALASRAILLPNSGEGFRLVSERGNLMENADPDGVGTMSAVLGLPHDKVEEVCNGINGTVVVANINSPLQIVISGEKSAVEKAGNILKERGAKRVMPLKVSGAFHSPMMENTRDKFAAVVDSISLSDALIPVYTNISAKPVTGIDEIRKAMVQQLVSSVLWTDTVNNIISDGVCEAFEIGPGNVLGGLAKRIDDTLKVLSVSNASKILEVVNEKN